MTEEELLDLAKKYQEKADRNYRNYQETGISRYDWERRNAELLAEAMRMAANASEDHSKLIQLRSYIYGWGLKPRALIADPCFEKESLLLNEIVTVAVGQGLIQKEDTRYGSKKVQEETRNSGSCPMDGQ